jgi:hypothetical protein
MLGPPVAVIYNSRSDELNADGLTREREWELARTIARMPRAKSFRTERIVPFLRDVLLQAGWRRPAFSEFWDSLLGLRILVDDADRDAA